ncbi:exodeoxyribonuclease V subunit gamma [Candidatus Methylocalor cossyra]|uniref:RecBCD enzyme subunit RecC n=1 Tax=Candidatus Methylocalor cossyra TaxID=3108543 RepID=A0ABP1C8T5_9GAMM
MLRLYQSNRLERLAQALAADYRPPPSPFEPDVVLVPSRGLGRWLALRLAERLGICGNLRFMLPAEWIWELVRALFGELPRRSPFSADVLSFRIMAWLGREDHLARAPRLAHYLHNGGELRRWQLARRIADTFDQYLVYREDWILAWERGETLGLGGDEAWQALLWRDLVGAAPALHRARLMSQLLARLAQAAAPDRGRLPGRLAVFGLSTLPPVFLEVLRALGAHLEVTVYALNPCREYWGEIRDVREIGRLAGDRRPEEVYLEVGHPLLASLGKQGREFFDALADSAETYDLFDANPPRDTLLHLLQADILELVDRKTAGPVTMAPDGSVQIHVCHSPMREVEVLRDQLLALFDADRSLTPGDVAVLAPDIEKYAPFIEAVFAEGGDAPRIPFSIADRGLAQQHPLLQTFLDLLDLPHSRLGADAVLGLLNQAAVLRRFGLAAEDLPQLRDWVRAVGARWGRDGDHRAQHGVPGTHRHTWRDALQRLMLGYALPRELAGDGLSLFGETAPYDEVEGSQGLILGRFAEFLETLFEWSDRLREARPPAQWADTLNALADRMLDPRGNDETVLLALRASLEALRELAEQAEFRDPLTIGTVKHWLAARLAQPSGTGGLFTGEVSFSALVPLRSLPFRVIALIGLDYEAFPRHRHPPGFDLMARHPRRGDRSRRLDDRYLFLETLLSARDRLYISYVGRSIRDNSEQPPSPLVSELLDVIKQSVRLPGDIEAHLVTEHPLQPFDPAYFSGDPRRPGYSALWLGAARWIGRGEKGSAPLFSEALPEPDAAWRTLDPDSLAYFFSHPARFLLRRRLNLSLEAGDTELDNREPFALDYAAREAIRRDLVQLLRRQRDSRAALRLAEAQGLLPHGPFGAALHARERHRVETLVARLLDDWDAPRLEPLAVALEADGVCLRGQLAGITRHGLCEFSFDDPKPSQLIRLWLRHLMLCLAAPEGVAKRSVLHTPGKTTVFQAVADPAAELAKFLSAYWRGLGWPLPFFPKSSYGYARARLFPPKRLAADTVRDYALRQARSLWAGSEHGPGEGDNAYLVAVYRTTDPLDETFETLALELLGPMLQALAAGDSAPP